MNNKQINDAQTISNEQYTNDIPSSKFSFDTFMGNKAQQNMLLAPIYPVNILLKKVCVAILLRLFQIKLPH